MPHPQWTKDFPLAEGIQRLVRQAFESDAKNDESDIAIFRAFAGCGGKRRGKGRPQKFSSIFTLQKKPLISRQARAVRQQHAQRDSTPAIITIRSLRKLRNHGSHWRFEIEQPSFVE